MQILKDKTGFSRWLEQGITFIVVFVGLAIFATIVIVFAYALNFGWFISDDQAVWGQFGDYVGGVLSSFYGLLGFLALAISIAFSATQLRIALFAIEDTRNARWEERVFSFSDQYRRDEFQKTLWNAKHFANAFTRAYRMSGQSTEVDDTKEEALGRDVQKIDHSEKIVSATLSYFHEDTPQNLNNLVGVLSRAFGPTSEIERHSAEIIKRYENQVLDFKEVVHFYAKLGFCLGRLGTEEKVLAGLFGDELQRWLPDLNVFIEAYSSCMPEVSSTNTPLTPINILWVEQIPRLFEKYVAQEADSKCFTQR